MIYKFNKFKFLKESYSEFNTYSQFGVEPFPLGAGYGFAIDSSISIFSQQDSPYNDQYVRTPMMVNTLVGVINNVNKDKAFNYTALKFDHFLEDVEELEDLKILRINTNQNLSVDIYISFVLHDEEFFGVYKQFNWISRGKLNTDLFTDDRFRYIDNEYILKLDNFFYKTLINWFKPSLGTYQNMNEFVKCKSNMGDVINLKKLAVIKVVEVNNDKDGNPYIKFDWKGDKYVINKNDYFFFNYWFEKLED